MLLNCMILFTLDYIVSMVNRLHVCAHGETHYGPAYTRASVSQAFTFGMTHHGTNPVQSERCCWHQALLKVLMYTAP